MMDLFQVRRLQATLDDLRAMAGRPRRDRKNLRNYGGQKGDARARAQSDNAVDGFANARIANTPLGETPVDCLDIQNTGVIIS